MKYKYVLMDLDNTLLDFGAAERYSFFYTAKQYGLQLREEQFELYRSINSRLWAMLETAEITKACLVVQRFEEFFAKIGQLHLDAVQFNIDYLANLGLNTVTYDGAEDVCRRISEQGTLIIATNGVSSTQHHRIEKAGLEKFAEHIIVSDDAGAEKPSPRYFEHLFEVCGIEDKSQCIIIGDSLTADIRGGRDFAIATCLFNPEHRAGRQDILPDFEIHSLRELDEIIF